MESKKKNELRELFRQGVITPEQFKEGLFNIELEKGRKKVTDNIKRSWLKQNALIKRHEQIGRPTINDVINIAKGMTNLQTRALFLVTYLTAGRITEIVKSLKGENISEEYRLGKKVLVLRLVNRKHKTRHMKELILSFNTNKEKEMIEMLMEYVDKKHPEELLFKFGKTWAYKLLIKETNGWNCHYLRHLRLTHLVILYGFDAARLMRWAGWSDSRPSKHYIDLITDDFLEKFPDNMKN